ncbi:MULTISPECIES: hypothetical protein [unclassified Streptomyces]|uniref:hypothetical protein n=1 Tax=unclassified Streptomyces TaxID=2593676 RepID=UPI0032466594
MPLPRRAARVLEPAALADPGEKEAREPGCWVDPRATGFFFRSAPAAAWLEVLEDLPRVPGGGEVLGDLPGRGRVQRYGPADRAQPTVLVMAGRGRGAVAVGRMLPAQTAATP